jgi:hypothetical protein
MGELVACVRIKPHRMTWESCVRDRAYPLASLQNFLCCELLVVSWVVVAGVTDDLGGANAPSYTELLGGQVILTQPKATESPPVLATVAASGLIKPSQPEGDSNVLKWNRLNASNPTI